MFLFKNDELLWRIPALLIAITFHEYAHARMAFACGDPTAKLQGRLTLNPIAHLDPIGTLMLLVARFGWAKPVPINPANFHDRRRGLFWVSLAGPGMNIFIGLVAIYLLLSLQEMKPAVNSLLSNIVIFNVFLAVFNIIPLPPLDGSKILVSLLPKQYQHYYYTLEPYGPFILIILVVLGLLPAFLVPVSFFVINVLSFLINLVIV